MKANNKQVLSHFLLLNLSFFPQGSNKREKKQQHTLSCPHNLHQRLLSFPHEWYVGAIKLKKDTRHLQSGSFLLGFHVYAITLMLRYYTCVTRITAIKSAQLFLKTRINLLTKHD